MKRTIAALCLAYASLACSNSHTTQAQAIPEPMIFRASESCDQQVKVDIRSDLATPGVVVGEYVDQKSPNALRLRALDNAYSKLSEEAYLLVLVASENGLSTKLSKREQARALEIATKRVKSTAPAPILTGVSNFDEGSILYQCFVDTCPQGSACRRIDASKRATKIQSSIGTDRKFVREVIRWAKSAGLAKESYQRLMATFERNAAYLSKEIPGAPKEVFLMTSKVKR